MTQQSNALDDILSLPTKPLTAPYMIDIDYTKRLPTVAYMELIWIEEDSIWVGEDRLYAFCITENNNDDGNFKIGARRQIAHEDGSLTYMHPQIAVFDSVAECKEFIFEYINTAPHTAIFVDQHRKALESLCA
jgi:hypothetical protein